MAIQSIGAAEPVASVLRPQGVDSIRARTPQAQPARMTAEQVEQVVKEVKQIVEPVAQDLEFSIDKASGQTVVKVVDTATKEVVRQIPSQELLAIARTLDKLQGLLLHKKA